jgi:YihY family inner membrane protein
MGQVLLAFHRNHGLLLASAVAYNSLLSLVPMLALLAVLVSLVLDRATVLHTAREYLVHISAAQAETLTAQLAWFLDNWEAFGIAGLVALLFFSSFAFSMLERAMMVIFASRVQENRRPVWFSLLLPYLFVLVLGMGVLVLGAITWGIEHYAYLGAIAGDGEGRTTLRIVSEFLAFTGEVILFASIYKVMPYGRVSLRHALVGGVVASLLWELMRRLLGWYFASLSLVNVVYGAFATAIVVILSIEFAAIILLLGAQVIAVYERRPGAASRYLDPGKSD